MSSIQPFDDVIRDLGADLKPVKRLRPPIVRAAVWLGFVALLAAALAVFADLQGIAHRLMSARDMWMAVSGSTLTFILGAIAVFQLSLPDRRPLWAWLPVPGLLVWIGASGMGCLRTWIIPQTHEASMGETRICLMFIVGISLPLSILLVAMIRRACPLRPGLTAVVAGITSAAAAATLLNFFHPYDASATDLVVHLCAVVIVVVANHLLAGRLLSSPKPVRSAGR